MTNILGTGLETEANELHHREVHECIYKPSKYLVGIVGDFFLCFILNSSASFISKIADGGFSALRMCPQNCRTPMHICTHAFM